MKKLLRCDRCHEKFVSGHSRYGQICPWCEQSMIAEERDQCRICGVKPMTKHEELEYLRDLEKAWLFA